MPLAAPGPGASELVQGVIVPVTWECDVICKTKVVFPIVIIFPYLIIPILVISPTLYFEKLQIYTKVSVTDVFHSDPLSDTILPYCSLYTQAHLFIHTHKYIYNII